MARGVNFYADTGASYTVITPRPAEKHGLQVNSEMTQASIITANGMIQVPIVTLHNVIIGQVRVNEVQAAIHNLGKDLMYPVYWE